MSKEESNKSTNILLLIATLLTVFVVVIFSVLSYQKNLLGLDLNEIGDSFAGFAGCLAFLWLIVTVLLQNTELRLQRKEVSGLKGASEDQARSLKASLQVQTLVFIRDRQKEVAPLLIEKKIRIGQIMARFLDEFVKMEYSEEFLNNPHEGVTWLLGYFLAENKDSSIDIKNVRADVLKQKFDYKAYLALSDILYLIDDSWNLCKPLFRDAVEYGYKPDFDSWVSGLNIRWYKDSYHAMQTFNCELKKIVEKGDIAGDLATFFISVDLIESDEKNRGFDVPFT